MELLSVAALVAVGAAVRAAGLGVQSFWIDELFTVTSLRLGFGDMLHNVAETEATPHLYYVAAWFWTRIAGVSEVGLRSFSVLAGSATIVPCYLTARKLWSREAALWAGALVAVNPFLVWYGQEARSYALLSALSGWLVLCFVSALQEPRRHLWRWGVVSAVAIAVHYYAAVLVLATGCWLLVRLGRRERLRVVLAGCAPGFVAVALVPLVVHQIAAVGDPGHVALSPLPLRVAAVPKNFLVGYLLPAEPVLTAIAASLVATGLVLGLRPGGHRRAVVLLGSVATGTAAVPIALAAVGVDFVTSRNLVPALVPGLVAVAAGLASSRAARAAGVALCLVWLVVIGSVWVDPLYRRPDWRAAAGIIGSPGVARVVVGPPEFENVPEFEAYFGRGAHPAEGTVSVAEVTVVAFASVGRYGSDVPRPPSVAARPAPPGFRLVEHRRERAMTIARYEAPRPTRVRASQVAALMFPPEDGVILLQAPEAQD